MSPYDSCCLRSRPVSPNVVRPFVCSFIATLKTEDWWLSNSGYDDQNERDDQDDQYDDRDYLDDRDDQDDQDDLDDQDDRTIVSFPDDWPYGILCNSHPESVEFTKFTLAGLSFSCYGFYYARIYVSLHDMKS